jgi:hypothetical protein
LKDKIRYMKIEAIKPGTKPKKENGIPDKKEGG